MKANEANLLDLMGVAKMQFIIPVYQRVYSWGVKECAVLWDDVMRAGRDNAAHFVGSMLYIPESESSATSISRVLLIDGQQRMTTFSLMIAALANYLESNPDEAGFLGDLKISALRKNYLFNDDDYNGLARYKLVLSQDDKETLFSIVSGSPCLTINLAASSRTSRFSAKRSMASHSIQQGFGRVSTGCRSSTPNSRRAWTTHSSYSSP